MHDVAKNISTETNVRRSRGGLGVAIGLLAAILIFVVGIKALQIGKMMSSPKMLPVTTVTSAAVEEEDWAPRLSAVGAGPGRRTAGRGARERRGQVGKQI